MNELVGRYSVGQIKSLESSDYYVLNSEGKYRTNFSYIHYLTAELRIIANRIVNFSKTLTWETNSSLLRYVIIEIGKGVEESKNPHLSAEQKAKLQNKQNVLFELKNDLLERITNRVISYVENHELFPSPTPVLPTKDVLTPPQESLKPLDLNTGVLEPTQGLEDPNSKLKQSEEGKVNVNSSLSGLAPDLKSKEEFENLEQKLIEQQNLVQKTKEEYDESQNNLNLSLQEVKDLKVKLKEAEDNKESEISKSSRLQDDLREKQKEYETLKEKLDAQEKLTQQIQEKCDLSEKALQLSAKEKVSYKTKLQEAEAGKRRDALRYNSLKTELEALEREQVKLKVEKEASEKRVKELESEINRIKPLLETSKSELELAMQSKENLLSLNTALEKELEVEKGKVKELEEWKKKKRQETVDKLKDLQNSVLDSPGKPIIPEK